MDYTCFEIEGTIYQPKGHYKVNNSIIIPATKKQQKGPQVLERNDQKLVFATQKGVDESAFHFFVFTYQFIFLKSDIYNSCSLPDNPKVFIESSNSIE